MTFRLPSRTPLVSRRRLMAGGAAVAGAGLVSGLGSGLQGLVRPASAGGPLSASASCPPSATSIIPTGSANDIQELPYSDGTYVKALAVFNVDDTTGVRVADLFDNGQLLSGRDTIVTNLGGAYATVYLSDTDEQTEGIAKSIPPRTATIITGAASVRKATSEETPSSGDSTQPLHLAFIRTASPRDLANILADTDSWASYTENGCWPTGVGPFPLFMSGRGELTDLGISLNPWDAANQATPSGKGTVEVSINTNLWWLPAMSDAAVHHCHSANFLEVHTQLMGQGRMQKFDDREARDTSCTGSEIYPLNPAQNPEPAGGLYGLPGEHIVSAPFPGMYEEYRLAPGDTNVPFAYVDDDMNFIYPWHQYYSDTDCLWVVWEITPIS
ncbi:hypothetical protein [Pseudohoeflea coraliihabitans]|uniref:Uncharacterized protein n=1 Tax=Pseudohoeflea coraliihabitans TaxID=2860393 RepID=A0ABS6WPT8_9HYPH|nr:hypothetical protein [Pseudohoeflea sp. DP4N28-3]MBW3097984.1 hypothetical protein [Pseudohoeflea sp. DP4N28-3]